MSVKLNSLGLNLKDLTGPTPSQSALDCPPEHSQKATVPRMEEIRRSTAQQRLNIAPIPSERGTDCLRKILTEIDAAIVRTGRAAQNAFGLHLQILDDIDFDCSQPLLIEVLWQLVTNAVSASVTAGLRDVDVFATQYKSKLYMQVADRGTGLPRYIIDWFRDREWDPAAKAYDEKAGLASAAKLVTWAGGSLTLVSTGANGTRIGFSLPLSESAGAPW